jgi:multiple sugar transport system substrate-binding protein
VIYSIIPISYAFFIRLVLALSLTLLLCRSAHSGEQADRAVALVKSLIAQGEITPGSLLRLSVKRGNIANFLGENYTLKADWERLTGTFIDVHVMPQQASYELISNRKDIDVTIARNREYPDLYTAGLIINLSPLLERFNFTFNQEGLRSGYFLPQLQTTFDGNVVAIPADGDVALLYLRRDLLENPENRGKFKQQFGYELGKPNTWEEYNNLLKFFNDPKQGFYAALEPRSDQTAWMYWIPRYVSQGNPSRYLFDDLMQPLIDSPAGIQATEYFIKTIAYSPPDILVPGNDYSYTLPFFSNNKGFSTIITLAGAKLFNQDSSGVKDKFVTVQLPGSYVNGVLVQRTTFIYGNNIVIPKSSKQPILAFLYAMWLTDPEVSAQMIGVKGGFADPFRYDHIQDSRIQQVYTREALDTLLEGLTSVVPAGTGLPGDTQYIGALNRNLMRAARGQITAMQAMKETAEDWNLITDQYGRAKQIKLWRKFRQLYPILRKE